MKPRKLTKPEWDFLLHLGARYGSGIVSPFLSEMARPAYRVWGETEAYLEVASREFIAAGQTGIAGMCAARLYRRLSS